MDLYEVLGIQHDATQDDVKKAYRKLVLLHHPDKAGNTQENTAQFVKLRQAYDILVDSRKRAKYDRTLQIGKHHHHKHQDQKKQDAQASQYADSPQRREREVFSKSSFADGKPMPSVRKCSTKVYRVTSDTDGDFRLEEQEVRGRSKTTVTFYVAIPGELLSIYYSEFEKILDTKSALLELNVELIQPTTFCDIRNKVHPMKIAGIGCDCRCYGFVDDIAVMQNELDIWCTHHQAILDYPGYEVEVEIPAGSRGAADAIKSAQRFLHRITKMRDSCRRYDRNAEETVSSHNARDPEISSHYDNSQPSKPRTGGARSSHRHVDAPDMHSTQRNRERREEDLSDSYRASVLRDLRELRKLSLRLYDSLDQVAKPGKGRSSAEISERQACRATRLIRRVAKATVGLEYLIDRKLSSSAIEKELRRIDDVQELIDDVYHFLSR